MSFLSCFFFIKKTQNSQDSRILKSYYLLKGYIFSVHFMFYHIDKTSWLYSRISFSFYYNSIHQIHTIKQAKYCIFSVRSYNAQSKSTLFGVQFLSGHFLFPPYSFQLAFYISFSFWKHSIVVIFTLTKEREKEWKK